MFLNIYWFQVKKNPKNIWNASYFFSPMTLVISYKPYKWLEEPKNIIYKKRKCWLYIQQLLTRAIQYMTICRIRYNIRSVGWKGIRVNYSYVLRGNGPAGVWSQGGRIPGPQPNASNNQDGKIQYMQQVDASLFLPQWWKCIHSIFFLNQIQEEPR